MKKEYSVPEVSIVMFENEDIITISSLMDFTMGDGEDLLWENLFGDI